MIIMLTRKEMYALRKKYPNGMSKEVFYKICHISKRHAQYLLESGIVPCIRCDKQTYRYLVSVTDVVIYLRQREIKPEKYAMSGKARKGQGKYPLSIEIDDTMLECLERVYQRVTAPYPDVLTIDEVSEITGYCTKSLLCWCSEGKLFHLTVKNRFLVPKLSLIEYMLGSEFRKRRYKSHQYWKMLQEAWDLRSANQTSLR